MLRPKKNSYKEFDNEKNSCSSKIPQSPITFLMVHPLKRENVNEHTHSHLNFFKTKHPPTPTLTLSHAPFQFGH